jgi:hypothetical protein
MTAARLNGTTLDITPRGELAVIVAAHGVAVAIAARWVSRLALPSDVRAVRSGKPGLVAIAGTLHASWDLGELLGLGPLSSAWVMLDVPHKKGTLRVALRTGACLVVEALPRTVALPRGALTARNTAVRGAFGATARHGGALFGLSLDPTRLFTSIELEDAAALLRNTELPSLP